MGFNKRYLSMDSIRKMAKSSSDFESFNLYMTHSDAHLFMDEESHSFYVDYVDLDMEKRKEKYLELKSAA